MERRAVISVMGLTADGPFMGVWRGFAVWPPHALGRILEASPPGQVSCQTCLNVSRLHLTGVSLAALTSRKRCTSA